MKDPFSLTWTVPPGNSGYVVLFDSTKGPANMSWSALTSNPAPGTWRGMYKGASYRYTIKTTTESVTVDEQVLTGSGTTNAAWETQGAAGTFTVAAGTTAARNFLPLSPDHRILVTAGGTAPATLESQLEIVFSDDYGS